MFDLENKTILITGANRGQGKIQAVYLASIGVNVMVGARNVEEAQKVVDEIDNKKAHAVKLDVTDETDWEEAVSKTVKKFGKIDALVNNAGLYLNENLVETSPATYMELIHVNQLGVFLGMQKVIPHMKSRGKGSIVNNVSISAFAPLDGSAAYASTKAAVVAMSKATAVEVGPYGIRVNMIHPGGINTEMAKVDGKIPEIYSKIPLQRIGEPEEIAHAVAFLTSDYSSYCTGAEIVVDGGLTLGTRTE